MLKLTNVSKIYRTAEVETLALNEITMEVRGGEFVAIMGPSGCGKSTLLNTLGLLDTPSSGSFEFFGEEVARRSERELTALRRDRIGFVFQSFNLIDDLSVAENVEVALLYRRVPTAERRRRVAEALERVGLGHRARHRPQQLSGGQQQRVAVARAMVSDPSLILADEPTGNLDTVNGEAVMTLLTEAAAAGVTVIMVTHSLAHAAVAQRTIKLLDGRVVSETLLAA
jgi:putative ABC transport system ATP-binding protein